LRLPLSDVHNKEFETDILVKDSELNNFHNILTAQGFEYSNDDILSHHHYRRNKLHLDLVISLCYGQKREHFISLGHEVLERAVFKNDMYFANNMDEFIMLLFCCLFNKKDFKKYSAKIFQLINIIGEEKCLKKMSSILN